MNFFVMPDKCDGKKGLSSERLCEIIANGLKKAFPNGETVCEAAFYCDEKSADKLTSLFGGKTVGGKVQDGNFFIKDATYGVSGEKAFISTASTSGIADTMIKDPAFTTSYGLGQQIMQASKLGKKEIILALGGSVANDGGAGAAAALGAEFYDEEGEKFVPTGGTLGRIAKIDVEKMSARIGGGNFTAICDASNPLLGENGCAYALSAERGAKTQAQREELEKNMAAYAEKTSVFGVNAKEEFTGAAGGLGYFTKAFLKGKTVSCTEWFWEKGEIEKKIRQADVVICGEDEFDGKERDGRYCGKIVKTALETGKKVIVICKKKKEGAETSGCEIYETEKEGTEGVKRESEIEFDYMKAVEGAIEDVNRKLNG